MNQQFNKLFLITALVGLLISSCRKDVGSPGAGNSNSPEFNRVMDWLNVKGEAYKNAPAISQTIASLKQNVIGSEISTEVLNDKQNLVIVPLKDDFKTSSSSQQSFKALVITESDHKLTLSNIIEIMPKDQHFNTVPADLILKVFKNQDNELSGSFSFFSLANTFMENREFKEGKLVAITHANELKKDAGTGARVEDDPDMEYVSDWDYEEVPNNDPNEWPVNPDIEVDNNGYFYIRTIYNYHAQIYRIHDTREIENVVVDPITATPIIGSYTNQYGEYITRYLTLFGNYQYPEIISPTAVSIYWFCYVNAQYYYGYGGSFSRQWTKEKIRLEE